MYRILSSFVLVCLFPSWLWADELLDRHIDVRFLQTPLKEALATVAQKGGFEWSYNANIVDGTRKVSLIANQWTVREILYDLLGEGYEFKSKGIYLILKKRAKPDKQVYGYLKDPATGLRIAHATVYDERTLRATVTDSNGYFHLKVPKDTRIAITRLHYRDTVFAVHSTQTGLRKIDLQGVRAVVPVYTGVGNQGPLYPSLAGQIFKVALNQWHALNVRDSLRRRFQLSLLPKIGTNHHLSAKVINDWSVNLLAGTSLGNRKVELGGLGNFTVTDMTGLQAAGLFNELRGNASGVQLGGIYNHTGGRLRGLQVAGLFNYSGFAEKKSVQLAGLFNLAADGSLQLQVAELFNVAKQINGVQAAGLVNVADTISGLQIAAIVNRSRRVRGVQIGLINNASELNGLQIGLINRFGKRIRPFMNWGKRVHPKIPDIKN